MVDIASTTALWSWGLMPLGLMGRPTSAAMPMC
ncbi:hypothetical protein LILAB_00165 [Corallococcus macrosporus]|uniref:Uncharacterized protein n=1 Tax=Myxococcus fulvus (strain ATCC BAA-855 / HW-1) TaxID=483219 RepID=F8C793_MYXFH|nr:hypothetical protein LILAB_00165 [Corallococcus macrosporus]